MTQGPRLSLLVGSLSLLSLACAPDPKVIAQQTAADVKALLREAWQTAETTNNWPTLDSSLAAAGLSVDARRSWGRVPAISTLDQASDTIDQRIGRVFADSNIVDKGLGALTFQVRGVDLCTGANGAFDASCADSVDRLRLHVRATGNLDLTLLVGPDKAEAFTLEIRSGVSIAVTADLAKTIAAVNAVERAISGASTLRMTATGRVEARLMKNGPGDFTVSTAVLSPLDGEVTSNDGITRKASVGAKNPMLSARLETSARRVTLKYGVGELRYVGPVRDVFYGEPTTRPMDGFLSGADGTFVFEDGKPPRLENVGFGTATSTVKAGPDLLLSFDFNKDSGRTTAATWQPTSQGFMVSFTPGLQLNAHVGFGVLENANLSVAPENRNANYTASFLAGAGKAPTVEFLVRKDSAQPALARIIEGVLSLAVDGGQVAPRTFTAPVCLGRSSGTVANMYIESFASVGCP